MRFSRSFSFAFVFFLGFALAACDSQLSTQEGSDTAVRTEVSTNDSLTARLDANLIQKRKRFDSMVEYRNHLNQLRTTEEVVVNEALYSRLNHANDPAEISLLDMEGKIVIGDTLYTVTDKAIYKQGLSSKERKIDIFYGESGKYDLYEVSLVYQHFPHAMDKLSGHEFKNPFAEDLYEKRLRDSKENQQLRTQNPAGKSNGNQDYVFKFFDSPVVSYPGGGRFPAGDYITSFLCWNESTGYWKRRAYAGTQTDVKRVGETGGYVRLTSDDVGNGGLGSRTT